MLGIQKQEEAPPTPQHPLSPMGDACSRMDLTAIHQILVMTHYKDDEGTNEVSEIYSCRSAVYTQKAVLNLLFHYFFINFFVYLVIYGWVQLSFQEWTQQMRDMLEARKRGDVAFREKDFRTAIDCYSQVCICFLRG